MSSSSKTLLMIRPLQQAEEFVGELKPTDEPVYSPLVEIEHLETPVPDGLKQPFLFTSANAVKAFVKCLPADGQSAVCSGETTADAAQRAGFDTQIRVDLAAELIARISTPNATYIRGEQVSFDLCSELKAKGCDVKELILYRQREIPLGPVALKLLETKPVLIPVFSKNAAKRLISELETIQCKNLNIAAISETVGKQLKELKPKILKVAATPDRVGMLKIVRKMI